MSTLGLGVIGLGFMGRTHIAAIDTARRAGLPCRVAAVCDGDAARLSGQLPDGGNLPGVGETAIFDPRAVAGYSDVDEFLNDPDVEIVHVCTWTDTHLDIAGRALKAGKHVVIEKPVAIRIEEIAQLAASARSSGRICMPAMCMRWWPGWSWLKERVVSGDLGPVRSAVFRRLGAAPTWTPFYADETRSGGALFDLHIHDVDFLMWCFGKPDSVQSTGSSRHVTTLYRYANGPEHVVAEGGWAMTPAAGFRMQYQVCFERAVAEFELGRTPTLTLHHADRSETPIIASGSGYEGEVSAMVRAVAANDPSGLPTLEDAMEVTKVLLAERESLRKIASA